MFHKLLLELKALFACVFLLILPHTPFVFFFSSSSSSVSALER